MQAEIEGQPAQKTLKLGDAGSFLEQPAGGLDRVLDRAASSLVADALSQALAEVAAEVAAGTAAATCSEGQGRPDAVLAGSVAAGAGGGAAGAAPSRSGEEPLGAALAGGEAAAAPEGLSATPGSAWGPAEQRQTVPPGAAGTPAVSARLVPSGELAGPTTSRGHLQPSQAQAENVPASPQEQPAASGSDTTVDRQQTEAVPPQVAETSAGMLPSDQLAGPPRHQQPSPGQAEEEPAAPPQEQLATPGAAASAVQADIVLPEIAEVPAAPEALLSAQLVDVEQATPAAGNAAADSVAGQAHETAAVRSPEGSSSPTAGGGMPSQVQSLGRLRNCVPFLHA